MSDTRFLCYDTTDSIVWRACTMYDKDVAIRKRYGAFGAYRGSVSRLRSAKTGMEVEDRASTCYDDD